MNSVKYQKCESRDFIHSFTWPVRGKDTYDGSLSLLAHNSFPKKVQLRQSPDIPLGCFEQISKNCNFGNQLESPL